MDAARDTEPGLTGIRTVLFVALCGLPGRRCLPCVPALDTGEEGRCGGCFGLQCRGEVAEKPYHLATGANGGQDPLSHRNGGETREIGWEKQGLPPSKGETNPFFPDQGKLRSGDEGAYSASLDLFLGSQLSAHQGLHRPGGVDLALQQGIDLIDDRGLHA